MSVPGHASGTASPGAVAQIGFGTVWHTRLRPRPHRFVVPTFFLLLPMRTLRSRPAAAGALALNRPGALAFHDTDHGDGRPPAAGGALAWLHELLQREGIDDADGEVWLHCYPRVLGYSFKPVSFWYCQRRDGSLRAVLAEVNNTFGERHAYLLDPADWDAPLQARKVFHVSPFCPLEGSYCFEFRRSDAAGRPSTSVRIDYHDADGPLLLTGIGGRLQPLDAAARRRALWRYPLLSLAVMARIHWHALLLWLKRAPLHAKPRPPAQGVTRSSLPHPGP